jgi:hypothetical protein
MKRSKEKKQPPLPIVHTETVQLGGSAKRTSVALPEQASSLLLAPGAYVEVLIMEECVILWPLRAEGLCQAALDANVKVARNSVAVAQPEPEAAA